jgi:3D-(3,5/4)-trihydroxycyclohexane-1,2-dione acylhydrolase (decyclizing)
MSNSRSGKTVRLTVAQAVVTYLSRQYSVADGERRRLIPATLGIFGHGNVAGMGQALDQLSDLMPFVQGRNEQSLVHLGVGYAKAMKRHATLAVTASIGPGALNTVTGAGLATVNRLPVLLLVGDTYATRRQGPVLQQLQHPVEADATVNDAFRPISRFFDRINRPEQLLTALPAAMRVLTDPVDTGAVVLSLPQDIQSHAFDFPAEFFAERDWVIRRPIPDPVEVEAVARMIAAARKPIISPAVASSTPAPPPNWSTSRARPASRCWRRWPARARSSRRPGGSSAGSAWRAPRRTTTWSARPTSCSPSGRG